MTNQLPRFPRIVFTILEPISLVGGWVAPLIDTHYFVSNQLPTSILPFKPSDYPLRPHETILALQVSNCYLLLGLLGLFILNTTTELKVVRAYLWALWLGDIGHVGVSAYSMGWYNTRAITTWNPVIWGNIGATVFLFTVRSLYFAGVFGKSAVKGKNGKAKLKQ